MFFKIYKIVNFSPLIRLISKFLTNYSDFIVIILNLFYTFA